MTIFWGTLVAVALLWPARILGPFDGLPLNGIAEAVLVGVLVPVLSCLNPEFIRSRRAQQIAVALLACKAATLTLPQQGLCARFTTSAPLSAVVLTIPVEDSRGFLRSWDVRAPWRNENPACTAIVDRPLHDEGAFPAWFLNILDFVRPGRTDLSMEIGGYISTDHRGDLVVETGGDMSVAGRIGETQVRSERGVPMRVALDPGSHRIDLKASFVGQRWRFVPTFDGADAFSGSYLATAPRWRGAGAVETILSPAITAGALALVIAWVISIVKELRPTMTLIAWGVGSTVVASLLATIAGIERLGSLGLAAAIAVPVPSHLQSVRGAFLLVGVPWLTLFVAGSLDMVGRYSIYSADDWLAYQVAGYRIFTGGYWLEGGTPAFDYQPLYRWISGLLHVVFGDSSVGEVYLDAICLLAGALLAFELVKRYSGFGAGLVAAIGTLVTFSLGTPWHFIGRGLSEIAAAGFGFLAAFFVLRAGAERHSPAMAAGLCALLMFYTRLNHLVFAPFLLALLLPIHPPANWSGARQMFRPAASPAAAFGAVFLAGIALFALRTWWYTGVFSLVYGTSLRNNDTGLRLTTLFSEDVWRRIGHSLNALLWMNEPPAPDVRAVLVVIGTALSVGSIALFPRFRRLPIAVAAVVVGATASSFVAHTHNYPGRMSIHLVPFAAAMTMCAVSQFAPFRAREAPDEETLQVVA